jgi:DNA-directed RNA polymerase subunit beta
LHRRISFRIRSIPSRNFCRKRFHRQRKHLGLEAVLKEVFPIESYDGRCSLEYVSYTLSGPKMTEMECDPRGRDLFHLPLRETASREEDSIKDEEIYMGEMPMITERGSFIINGAERVVVSQLHRSPGIAFETTPHTSGKILHSFRIIPDRGTWLETQFDQNDLLYVYLDRRRRRRKFLITTLLRAMGYSSDFEILNFFYEIEDLKVKPEALEMDSVSGSFCRGSRRRRAWGGLARSFEPLTKTIVRSIEAAGIDKVG